MCAKSTRRSPSIRHKPTDDVNRPQDQTQLEEQYFETLVIQNPAAIIAVGFRNNIISWNPAAEALFGYSQAEAIGQNIDYLIATEEDRAEAVAYSQQAAGGDLVHAITRRKRKDGALVDVEVYALPVTVEGTEIAAFAIYHDITELQHARQEAETANRAKSTFLAMMSHEIRTPMNGIIGMTSLLLDTVLTPEQREYAETIRTSSEALLTIINDILDFSKIEAGKMDLENQPFDLRECIESALDLVAAQAREKRLELACLIAPEAPATLMGDVTRLRQILLNLLSNALKFTQQGEIVVSVDIMADAESSGSVRDKPGHGLHFRVQDTGIGIPTDRIEHLFQSFSQLDASIARRYGGTGLGLAISKRLAEMMGGTMWVESEVSKGSTFHFTVVAETAPAHARMYLRSEQPHLHGRRVIIVDDNATNRRILVAQARSWGMIPHETAFPHEALEWITRGDPCDLMLLDMQMPDMDGLTLATEIRRYRDADSLPVVMLSSLGRMEAGASSADFAAYLTKPVKQSVLYDTMIGVFAGQSAPGPDSEQLEEAQFDARMADRLPLRILLAEDHAINQKLALQMLRKIGYRADVAGNGLEVLAALERQHYDIVLMDVQMPEMDGLEATRRIHHTWGSKRPRIIAMTANAMQGDREECLAAGMDDYVSKPVLILELQIALERWGQTESAPVSLPPDSPRDLSPATIDWAVLDGLRTLQQEGEADFVQGMITLYLNDTPPLIDAIQQAILQDVAEELRRAAHALKGNSNSLGAKRMGALSLDLEKIGRSRTVEGAEPLLVELKQEFERVRRALRPG